MIKAKKFEIQFIKKNKESKDAYSFYFDRRNLNFDFIPGQYIKIFLDIENVDQRGTSRYFTISSSPTDKEYLVITTKIIKSSFKKHLLKLNSGETVKAFGPVGYFDFDPKENKNIVLLAGGIGITPYHSLIRYIDSKKISTNVTLIVSFDLFENIIFRSELEEIEAKNKHVKIIYTLTKEKNLYPGFEKGRITDSLIKRHVDRLDSQKFYIVGSEKAVEGLHKVLKKLKIKEENIFKEDFSGY